MRNPKLGVRALIAGAVEGDTVFAISIYAHVHKW